MILATTGYSACVERNNKHFASFMFYRGGGGLSDISWLVGFEHYRTFLKYAWRHWIALSVIHNCVIPTTYLLRLPRHKNRKGRMQSKTIYGNPERRFIDNSYYILNTGRTTCIYVISWAKLQLSLKIMHWFTHFLDQVKTKSLYSQLLRASLWQLNVSVKDKNNKVWISYTVIRSMSILLQNLVAEYTTTNWKCSHEKCFEEYLGTRIIKYSIWINHL